MTNGPLQPFVKISGPQPQNSISVTGPLRRVMRMLASDVTDLTFLPCLISHLWKNYQVESWTISMPKSRRKEMDNANENCSDKDYEFHINRSLLYWSGC